MWWNWKISILTTVAVALVVALVVFVYRDAKRAEVAMEKAPASFESRCILSAIWLSKDGKQIAMLRCGGDPHEKYVDILIDVVPAGMELDKEKTCELFYNKFSYFALGHMEITGVGPCR